MLLGLSSVQAFAGLSPFPNIQWGEGGHFLETKIRIATDEGFENVIDTDRITNLDRYVPVFNLNSGTYFWEAQREDGSHFKGAFDVHKPAKTIRIPLGSDMSTIRDALSEARESGSTRIQFEPGRYDLHPGNEGNLFEIKDTHGLVIDGSGATFVLRDIASLSYITGSSDITLQNFTLDYAVPIYTAARVESIDQDGTMVLSLVEGHAKPETVQRFMEEKRGLFYDPEQMRMAEGVSLLVHMKHAWEPLGEGRYRLKLKSRGDARTVQPGMVYICAPRYKAQGNHIYESDNITFADVTTYYLPGIGVSTNFSDELKLIRFKMLRREDRFLGVQNGGTNIHGARIGPWVEACRFENTGDDNNHISSLLHVPVAQPAPNQVMINHGQAGVRYPFRDMRILEGDQIAFFDRLSATLLAKAKVVSVEKRGKNRTLLTLDRELPVLVLGDGKTSMPALEVTQIYNLDRSCGHFAFRNNTFLRGRRIGILAKSCPGLIENNRFDELGGGGVEIWNAPFEGLHGHEILIQGNTFRRGGLTQRNKPSPAIWIDVFHWGVEAKLRHSDIRILNNTILDYKAHAMELNDVDGLVVEGNLYGYTEDQLKANPRLEAIHLVNVQNAEIQNNHTLVGNVLRKE